ncbi:hypothetical protein J7T55_007008 [Diaporthe amygdali]|uniref:uncharacterized protein n=1 Tax=Phomopsis amygdali TaxID=1214568 RepID=UPI0022FE6673|nr:uncharacterized protein J7T55_007008 [Diaporthe amygdali]KAJ0104082.1 hypothetical protein J7T55_007008 [Diaporthe amygdali]
MLLKSLLPAVCTALATSTVPLSNINTSLTLLYQNNLNFTDDINHAGALLLDPLPYDQAQAACVALNEQLLPSQIPVQNATDLGLQLRYQSHAGYTNSSKFWVDDAILIATLGNDNVPVHAVPHKNSTNQSLPVLCTQTQPGNDVGGFSPVPSTATITIESGDTYQGFRNKKAFWFTGVRYAQFPGRFRYTEVYPGNGSVVPAQLAGPQCLQYGSGSEDCFFLNIETPYIPRVGSTKNLRPVVFWIHGGGFTGGQGAGNGGQFATREDVVTVTVNYRLSTYGFFAVPGHLPGNYGLADQITALDWVIANIEKFGGDPTRITIAGQSAGAGSVRVMLGSRKAIGKFHGAVDGQVINTEQLILTSSNENTAYVPIIFGVAEDDGASVGSYSKTCTNEADCLEQNLSISPYYSQHIIDSGLFPLHDTGNLTADSVNVSVRVNTDLVWRCAGEATVYAGAQSGAVPAAYFYESVRAYPEEAYNPLGLDISGAITPGYPLGNPNTFYYKVHSSDIPNFFGALHSYRDINDLLTIQLTSGYFGSFIRTGEPNPDLAYLQARGYQNTIKAIHEAGPWPEVSEMTGPIKKLDYPSITSNFVDQLQCDYLNSSVTYYLDGGKKRR